MDGISWNLDVARSALLQHVLENSIERLGPCRVGHGRRSAEERLRYRKWFRHGREGSEGGRGVESVVQEGLVRLANQQPSHPSLTQKSDGAHLELGAGCSDDMKDRHPLGQTPRDTTTPSVYSTSHTAHVDSLQGAQLAHTEGGDDHPQSALDSGISIGRIRRIELIGISHPLDIGVLLDVVELSPFSSQYPHDFDSMSTHKFQVVITRHTLDILDAALLQSFDDILGEWDGARHPEKLSINDSVSDDWVGRLEDCFTCSRW